MPALNLAKDINQLLSNELPIRAEIAKRHLYDFVIEFWDTIIDDPFVDNWHIEKICNELEKIFWRVQARLPKEYDLLINIPPGSTKSTIAMRMFPVWGWINDPTINFITGSYASDLILELADDSRDIINSPKFKQFYPNIYIRRDHDLKSNYQIMYKKQSSASVPLAGGNRYSTSSGGTITGKHGHIILIDDPIDPKRADAISDVNRKSVNDWIDKTLSTRKTDKMITPTITIMQRLHQDDPAGHMLDKLGNNIKHICLPGEIIDGDKNVRVLPDEWRKHYTDGLLDPNRLSREALFDLKTRLGNYGYAAQVLQTPIPFGGAMFDADKLIVLENCPSPSAAAKKIFYWDKAGTANAGAFTAGVLLWKMRNPYGNCKYIIVKIIRGQWAAFEREEIIKREAQQCAKGTEIWIEQEPGSGGKESAESTIKNLTGFKVYADRPTGNKISRADPFSVQVGRGVVGIVNGPWINNFLDEMRFFPMSKYKDQIDAASAAYNQTIKTRKAGVWGK